MNFKGFLKKTGFLNEDGDPDQEKHSFILNAYRKSYPKSKDTAGRDDKDLWNAVLKKASYKLTDKSKKETRTAVQFAKGAKKRGLQKFNLSQDYKDDTYKKDSLSKNLTDHLEDWTEDDFDAVKDQIKNISFLSNVNSLEDLKKEIGKLPTSDDEFSTSGDLKNKVEDLFKIITDQEKEVEGEKAWKDKTIEDIDGLDDNDFNKIKDKLKEIPSLKDVTNLEELKKALEENEIPQDQIDSLDKLLEPEKTPANQDPPAEPNPPAETGRPETANRDHQRQMEEMEKKRKLEKKLKDNDIPVKEDGTPDFDNPKTLEKINELMINGDDELYKEYILAKGGNQSDLAKQIAQDTAKENELIRTDIENRTARREAEKDQQKAICNIALALDVIFSFLAGKTQDGFSTLANKRVQAKALETQLKTAFNDDTKFQETQKEIETAHNAELENITKKEKQRLSEIERDRQTPRGTPAFKRKAMELSQEYDKKRAELQEKSKKIDQAEKVQTSIKNLLRAKQVGTEITADNQELRDIYPIDTANNETPEAYTERLNNIIQSDTFDQDLEKKENEIQTEIENFNAEADNLEKDFNKALNDLEADPEVQSEFKDANAAYEFKKANIQAEMNVLRAKEEKRFKDRISVNKQIFEEREKLLKNVATLSQWSSDPKEVMRTEFLNFNRKAKSMYESRGLTFNEDNDPALSDNDEVLKEYFANFETNMSDRIKQREQAQQGQGKGKKDDETGGKKPQRPPFGGHKPNETDGGEGGKTQNTGDGKKQLESLKGKFVGKPLASQRLDAFLKGKGLDPEDQDYDTKLQDAIKEFNSKSFPKTDELSEEKLKELGLTSENIPVDATDENGTKITTLDAYAKYLKNENNAESLKKLKEELGFEGTGGLPKPKPKIEIKNFDQTKLQGVKVKDANDNEIEITQENFEQNREKPQVLAAFSKDEIETLDDINNESAEDQTQDPKEGDPDYETKKKKLKSYSLKTLWTKLNKAGISIRALPGYDPSWTVADKKKAIAEYIGKHSNDIQEWNGFVNESKNLTHRKTAFKRLNEMSQAQKRATDRRTLRKFSELLVKDFRDFT